MAAASDVVARDYRALITDPDSDLAERLHACEMLIALGHLDEVADLLQAARTDPAFGGHARKALSMCRYLQNSPLINDLVPVTGQGAEAPSSFLYRCEGASRLSIVFTGSSHRFMMSLDTLHQFLKPQNQHILYLLDFNRKAYLGGVPGLGENFASTVDSIKGLRADLGNPLTYCIGASMGGYGALRYGLEIGARRVALYGGVCDLVVPCPYGMTQGALALFRAYPDITGPLRPLYDSRPDRPELLLYYGADSVIDRAQASVFAGMPGAMRIPLPGTSSHSVVAELLARGEFAASVDRLLSENGAPA